MSETNNNKIEKKKRKRNNKKNKKNVNQDVTPLTTDDKDDSEEEDDILNFLNMSPSAQAQRENANKLAAQEMNAYLSNHMGNNCIAADMRCII